MSLLSTIEQAIKSCKVEQAKIHDRIQLFRDILQTLTSSSTGSEELDSANDAVTDTDASPGEREDIELLERALEKALQVRTGTGPSKKDSKTRSTYQRETHTAVVTRKDGMLASAACKVKQDTRQTSVSVSYNRKENGQSCASAPNSKEKNKVLSGRRLGKAASLPPSTSNNTERASQSGQSGACSLPQQNGKSSDQIEKWKSLRRKKDRLWDKVTVLHMKPEPGRCHFMERMRATFPKDWPCGSPDQTRALLNRLFHQGYDLTQHCRTKEHLDKHAPGATTELGSETLETLQITAVELHKIAIQAKKEWEAWDRWRPEGGCLCPTVENGVSGDGTVAPLPTTITYTTEAELRELEKLRMNVALLQQEICLEQALLDLLTPQFSSLVSGPGCPNISMLRAVYSLLGEGGQRFPAIVLDSEPD